MVQDAYGYGQPPTMSTERLKNDRLIQDHITVWNRLVDNKGPLALKQDEIQWEGRAAQLMEDESFRNLLKANTIKDKIIALRDAGLGSNKEMTDEELSQFLMTHAPSGLTEDPNVSEQAIEATSVNKENPFSSYYNYPKMWGKDYAPEERYYSDPEEKGKILPPWIK